VAADRRAGELRQLSRRISHALRHAPWLYELEPDEEGWVPVEALLAALRRERRAWTDINEADLQEMMDRSDKQRFELRGGRIRALYGHSLPGKIHRQDAPPPPVLYHGTSQAALDAIMREGLRPMRRQFVHLSSDVPTAMQVARRKGGRSRILQVDAQAAARSGVKFYAGNGQVWMAEAIPARFLHPLPG
jgi:putative RNA 2'-phosphotransferase